MPADPMPGGRFNPIDNASAVGNSPGRIALRFAAGGGARLVFSWSHLVLTRTLTMPFLYYVVAGTVALWPAERLGSVRLKRH